MGPWVPCGLWALPPYSVCDDTMCVQGALVYVDDLTSVPVADIVVLCSMDFIVPRERWGSPDRAP